MDARILTPIAHGAVRFLQFSSGSLRQNLLAAGRPIVDFLLQLIVAGVSLWLGFVGIALWLIGDD